jgi:hypothetical protein
MGETNGRTPAFDLEHMKPWIEEKAGSVVAAAGVGWAVYYGTYVAHDITQGFTAVYLKSGPLEVCAIGILIWLHGKWRRWTSVNK